MVPLTPGEGVGLVEGGLDGEGAGGGFAVEVDGDGPSAVGGVEKVGGVEAGVGDFDGDVEPLAGLGPADVELVFGREDERVGAVVSGVGRGVELGVGGVDALVDAELVEVGAVGGIELAGAVIDGVGVVVGDAFAAAVVEGALYFAGDGLGCVFVVVVAVGGALVVAGQIVLNGEDGGGEERGEEGCERSSLQEGSGLSETGAVLETR